MIEDLEIPAELSVGTCEACQQPKLRDGLANSWHPWGSGTAPCRAGLLPEAYFLPAESDQQRIELVAAMNENFRAEMAGL